MRTEATRSLSVFYFVVAFSRTSRLNAAEHFETWSVFCVQNMTRMSHLKRSSKPRLPADVAVHTGTSRSDPMQIPSPAQYLQYHHFNIYQGQTIPGIEKTPVFTFVNLNGRRCASCFAVDIYPCCMAVYESSLKTLTRVQIYMKRWKCFPPREACDKKLYWNSMREVFFPAKTKSGSWDYGKVFHKQLSS